METISEVKELKAIKPKHYTCEDLKQHDVPHGIYESIERNMSGYWIVSDIALFHYSPNTRLINTVGKPSTMCEPYKQVVGVKIQFNLIFP